MLRSRFREALGAVLIAGATDWLDGFAARRLHVSGRIGVVLDPIADKALLMTVFLVLGYVGLVPGWLIYLVVSRDVVILVGALLLRALRDIRQFLPSGLGKVSTFFQVVLVLIVLACASFTSEILMWLREIALILCLVFTALSGLDYIRRGLIMIRTDAQRV